MRQRRSVTTVVLAALLTLGLLLPAGLALAQVTAPPGTVPFRVSVTGDNQVQPTTGRCRVLTASTFNTDAPTIYTDAAQTVAATTLTAAGWAPFLALDSTGSCRWYAPTGTNSFDVIVYMDSGAYAGAVYRADGVTRTSVKRLVLHADRVQKHLAIPVKKNTGTITSTITLPAGAVVTGALVEVVTAVGGSTVSVGYAGGAVTDFCNAASSATAGFIVCSMALSTSVGTAASALTYTTSNHNLDGVAHVYYLTNGGN